MTPRTRLLLINSPHNPTGKVLSREELETIANVCVEHDLIAVTDEVYEHIVFDGEHIPLATLPGMRDRVLTISSGGKSFSCTGWKIGWVCGPAALVRAVRTAKQFLTYVNGGPFQPAIAVGLRLPDDRINALGLELKEKRDRLSGGLGERGAHGVPTVGHLLRDGRHPLGGRGRRLRVLPHTPARAAEWSRCRTSSSTTTSDAGKPLVRFAFCKKMDVIDEAVERLQKLNR